jgi:hypothetical protein
MTAILLSALDFSNVPASEFHDWQDKEHIPERLRVSGFLSAQRWLDASNPAISVNTYDLEGAEVLKSPAYLSFAYENASPWAKRVTDRCTRLIRVAADQIAPGNKLGPDDAEALLFNAMNIPAEHDADFNAWYCEEHLPALSKVPGTLAARFFRAPEGASHRYLAVYHLASPEIPVSPAWRKAADTPWSDRVRPLFRDRIRMICRRYRLPRA